MVSENEDEEQPPPENPNVQYIRDPSLPIARLTAPPQWRTSNYKEWRMQVEVWDRLCNVKKIDPAEREYALYNQLSLHSDHNVVSKINSAVKSKVIDILGND